MRLNPEEFTEMSPGVFLDADSDKPIMPPGNIMTDIKNLLTKIKESGQIKEEELKKIKPKKKK